MIHLFSTFGAKRQNLIPQFITHYRQLGVEKFHITLHTDNELSKEEKEEILTKGADFLKTQDIFTYHHLDCKFDAPTVRKHHDKIQANIPEQDWIIWADLDEFQEYWMDLNALIIDLEAENKNVVYGEFLDRLSADGQLVAFDPKRSIFNQYPLGSKITEEILGGCSRKTTLARADVHLCPGNHVPLPNQQINSAFYSSIVHHFKWDDSVKHRLEARRKKEWKENFYWWKETDNFFTYIDENRKIKFEGLTIENPADYKARYFSFSDTIRRNKEMEKR